MSELKQLITDKDKIQELFDSFDDNHSDFVNSVKEYYGLNGYITQKQFSALEFILDSDDSEFEPPDFGDNYY